VEGDSGVKGGGRAAAERRGGLQRREGVGVAGDSKESWRGPDATAFS
jgi:hypothetical protein